MRVKMILLAIGLIAISFLISFKAMDWLSPRGAGNAPELVELPPLSPVPRTSTIMVPVAIALTAIRDAVERGAPRNFTGKADNPVSQILQNADINWTAARGPITTTGAQNVLSLSTPLTGNLNVTGSLSANAKGALGDALGSLLGGNVAKQIGSVNIKALNANAEIRGNVTMTARPTLLENWRIEPNLTAQVTLGDTAISVAGARVSVPAQVKPVIDKAVNDQIASVQARIRNDPALEQNARREWSKICRSIPLQGAHSALQSLWLEMRPTRAIAAQPRIDTGAVTLIMGIEAETRITSSQTKPDCPFPATLSIVPPGPGKLDIAVPIDMPFVELNKIVTAQFAGKTFPEDGSGSVDVTVKDATVAASGDRLLISLLVHAKEKKSLFGLGGEATVYIWGRPTLDQAQQTLRLTDLQLAVQSEAAFGLLGTAARAAMPYLQKTLADNAAIDLKPFASNAQRRIAALIADYQKSEDGIRVDAEVTSLRLSGIAFDSKTLRVIAQAEGFINVAVTALTGL
jgi:uncharacterized protein DUF4403